MTFIPFLKTFLPKIDAGVKTKTFRSKAYGKKGEVLDAPGGRKLRLLEDPVKTHAWDVAAYHFLDEGCDSPEHFLKVLSKIHRKPVDAVMNMDGFLHRFEKVQS